MPTEYIECEVWNGDKDGWGLKVLGDVEFRRLHFQRSNSPVLVELRGVAHPFNIDKKGFWNRDYGELAGMKLREWIAKTGLKAGDQVWLEVLEPLQKFRALKTKR